MADEEEIVLRDDEHITEIYHATKSFTKNILAPFEKRRELIITNQRVVLRGFRNDLEIEMKEISDVFLEGNTLEILKKGMRPAKDAGGDCPEEYSPYLRADFLENPEEAAERIRAISIKTNLGT